MVNLNIESELCKDLICNPNDRQRNSQEHHEGTLIMSKGSRILIVDDEPDVLELLEYNLREAGYVILLAEDGQQALEKARNEQVSTLIEVKVLPGTMTEGYHSWWRVGVPEVSNCEATQDSHLEMAKEISKARAY